MASNIFSNVTGGNWSLATNWSAGTVPDSSTTVTFASGTYTSFVDSTGAPWTIQSLNVNVATVTLEVDANLTAGGLSGNLGTINVDNGAILMIQSLNSGSGTISVSNGSELIVGKLNNSNGNIIAGPNGLVDLGAMATATLPSPAARWRSIATTLAAASSRWMPARYGWRAGSEVRPTS